MARIGYARVSSVGQSLAVQLDQLSACDKIYQEKQSGAGGKRPSLAACLEYVRDGDALVVTRLDRLARSTLHLCQIAAELQRKGVDLQVVDQQIDTHTSTGRLLFHMLGLDFAHTEFDGRPGGRGQPIPAAWAPRGAPRSGATAVARRTPHSPGPARPSNGFCLVTTPIQSRMCEI
jgi:hypothetical protein